MAFQPIVDVAAHTVYAYEALVRGPKGEPAASVLGAARIANNHYRLDRACRTRAIQLAADLGIPAQGAKLSINFMPGSVFDPRTCLLNTLRTAAELKFPLDSLIFEILEDERVDDLPHLRSIVAEYHRHGFHLALDDFGAGYSSLTLLARISADIVKLDAGLVRNVHTCSRTRTVLRHTVEFCRSLGILIVAEAVGNRRRVQHPPRRRNHPHAGLPVRPPRLSIPPSRLLATLTLSGR